MRIDSSGNVGIGTGSPQTPFSLQGNGGIKPVGITQNQVGGGTTMELTTEDLVKILTEPKNAMVKQYSKLLALEGVELNITKDALQALAEEAVKRGTGARALRSIFEKMMLDIMYDLPSRKDVAKVTINRAVVEGKKPPALKKKSPGKDKDAA